ncbi:hypothetical protein VNI00_005398 [Paramarasmius palmivorus]|uniref:Ricin B lectin domain-containing protein n=1 Tax=Paramarasmius palmivorus TaxID=297713 RepID=A0AAW0DEV3_9AGAR
MFTPQLVALSLLAVVSANPLAARATCSPNFEGAGISIMGANGFVTPNGRGHGSPAPFWHIQQNGQSTPAYVFRDIANDNIALTRNSDNTVTMAPVSNSGTDPTQQFEIVCQTCSGGAAVSPPGTLIASGCNIRWSGNTGLCLQVDRAPSDNLFVAPCGSVPGAQNFSFST